LITRRQGTADKTKQRSRWVRLLAPLAGAKAHDAPRTHPTRQRLIQAGYRLPSSLVLYLGGRVALAIALPSALLLSSPVWSLSELQLLGLLLAAAGLGFIGPGLWLDRARAVRQREVIHGLPDALDLLVVCVEAGLGINASLARVARENARSNPILSSELELVTLEIRAGKSTTEALRALAERTGVAEVSSLVAMLVQTERFGTSLTDTLRVQADAMRVQRLHRAEEQAGKAPLKMIFPTLLIFLATLIVTIGPGMLQFFSFFEGSGG
jgi:tight adherence protein C